MARAQVLDHGYVELVEAWGSDEQIIEAARMSTGKGFLGWGPTDEGRCEECRGTGKYPPGGYMVSSCPRSRDRSKPTWCEGGRNMKAGDERLLAYLWRNKHATPFEMAGLTIEVMAPIFVFREWHRHRVPFGYNEMCLAGDTEITCVGSNGAVKHYTIEHIYKMKHEGVVDVLPSRALLLEGRTRNGYSRAGTPVFRDRRLRAEPARRRVRLLPSCQNRTLRVLDEASEIYTTAAMDDVWQSGVKEVWRVETPQGRGVNASIDHPFYTREGWKKLGELRPGDRLAANGLVPAMERPVPPSLRAGIGVWTTMMRSRLIAENDVCYMCGQQFGFDDLELDHVVPVALDLRKALDDSNLKPICKKCHRRKTNGEQALRQTRTQLGLRWIELTTRPVRVGEGMTYDISVKGSHHNFVANGLVVHNSARYIPLPDVNYVPTVERLLMRSKANKQAGTAAGASDLTEEGAEDFRRALAMTYASQQALYEQALSTGVPKELARVHLPVGRYSRMRATSNLRGWLAFLALRMAEGAQWEIRTYANEVGKIVAERFPRTWEVYSGNMNP